MRPVRAYTSQLQSNTFHSKSNPKRAPAASSARMPSGNTSLPMPSPGITAIRCLMSSPLLDDPLAERGQDLVHGRRCPDAEERRLLKNHELSVGALPRLCGGFTRARGADPLVHHDVLVIDGRILDVAVEQLPVLRVERRDGNRLPGLAVLHVQELGHDVGVAVRRFGEAWALARPELLAVTGEDPKLEVPRLGETSEHWHIAPAVR